MKYVLISGGVMSGIGKGIVASSVGVLLQSHGLDVTAIKIDPYLNVDAGLMSPNEHGEVYVLADGAEADLDLGNYERFLDVELTRNHSITTGQVYKAVIERERRGDYLGKTVQVVPHVTDEIQRRVESAAKIPVSGGRARDAHPSDARAPDVCVIELGGTVGDIESMPFVEALRQLAFRHKNNFVHLHLSYVAELNGEQKSKPTQHSIKKLCSYGLVPHFVVCRSERILHPEVYAKVALFGQIEADCVLSVPNVQSIYDVPRVLNACSLVQKIHKLFPNFCGGNTCEGPVDLAHWPSVPQCETSFRVALIGKYSQPDAYLSIARALEHAAIAQRVSVKLQEVDLDLLCDAESTLAALKEFHAIIVPGGFGERGFTAKMLAAQYAREGGIPFLGICFGFQIAVIEIARNLLGIADATSEEFETEGKAQKGTHVIKYMADYSSSDMGATMRLGARKTFIGHGAMRNAYGSDETIERHRHRYEVNLSALGDFSPYMKFTGVDERGERMEILELKGHPYFIGTQFHPEFTSRPLRPSPVFASLVAEIAKEK